MYWDTNFLNLVHDHLRISKNTTPRRRHDDNYFESNLLEPAPKKIPAIEVLGQKSIKSGTKRLDYF